MIRSQVFGGRATKTIECAHGVAYVNPEYLLRSFRETEINPRSGVPTREFASWYHSPFRSSGCSHGVLEYLPFAAG